MLSGMDDSLASGTRRFRNVLLASSAALVLMASAVGAGAYAYLRPPAAASGELAVVPLTTMSLDDQTQTDTASTLYAIQSGASQATFTIDEVLRGSPKTVVGTTSDVSGQVALDAFDASSAQVGTILIDARTLQTDDTSRTRVLDNQILDTNDYEFISLTPTSLSGLPDAVNVGQPFTFQLTGDLTIRNTTRPVTFDVTATLGTDRTLTGTATSTIEYSDWGITIPDVPFVASVGDQVVLGLNFDAVSA
jgi:polyisoprenoid-binding protein YceI